MSFEEWAYFGGNGRVKDALRKKKKKENKLNSVSPNLKKKT